MRSLRGQTGLRIASVAVTGATVLTLAAGAPALAKRIDGTPGSDRLVGTNRNDTVRGYQGNDKDQCARGLIGLRVWRTGPRRPDRRQR